MSTQQPTQWQQQAAPAAQQWQQPPAQQYQAPSQQYQPPQAPQAYSAPPNSYPPTQQGYAPPAGYAQPGAYPAGPTGYPQAYAQPQAEPTYSTSALVAVAGMVMLIFGLIDAIAGGFLFTNVAILRDALAQVREINIGVRLDRAALQGLFGALPATLIVLGLLEIIAGVGIFSHKGWGRALGILLSLIGLLVSIGGLSFALALAPGLSVQVLTAVVFLLGYGFILLALLAGGSHFRRRYPAQSYPPPGYPPQGYAPR